MRILKVRFKPGVEHYSGLLTEDELETAVRTKAVFQVKEFRGYNEETGLYDGEPDDTKWTIHKFPDGLEYEAASDDYWVYKNEVTLISKPVVLIKR